MSFKIGDEVITTRAYDNTNKGTIGIVRGHTENRLQIEITYPREFRGHDCCGTIPNNKGYNIPENCLELNSQDIGEDLVFRKSPDIKTKMEKATTQLEKDALKKAKEDVVKAAIDSKARDYAEEMRQFIEDEKTARSYRKRADTKKELLGITKGEMDNLF